MDKLRSSQSSNSSQSFFQMCKMCNLVVASQCEGNCCVNCTNIWKHYVEIEEELKRIKNEESSINRKRKRNE